MMTSPAYTYEETPHTADLAMGISAVDLQDLFRGAVEGMLTLFVSPQFDESRREEKVRLSAPGPEALLVDFLNELLYRIEERDSAPYAIESITTAGDELEAVITFAGLHSHSCPIKAATYHDLLIRDKGGRLTATIIFDV